MRFVTEPCLFSECWAFSYSLCFSSLFQSSVYGESVEHIPSDAGMPYEAFIERLQLLTPDDTESASFCRFSLRLVPDV
jgi:hypothetical protein